MSKPSWMSSYSAQEKMCVWMFFLFCFVVDNICTQWMRNARNSRKYLYEWHTWTFFVIDVYIDSFSFFSWSQIECRLPKKHLHAAYECINILTKRAISLHNKQNIYSASGESAEVWFFVIYISTEHCIWYLYTQT